MAQRLSMEDLIKKYKYLRNAQEMTGLTPRRESSAKEKFLDDDSSKYSKLSSSSTGATSKGESNAPTNPEDACKVCMDAPANCAFIDCGHVATCLDCAKLLTKCPICRETIKRTLRIYKS